MNKITSTLALVVGMSVGSAIGTPALAATLAHTQYCQVSDYVTPEGYVLGGPVVITRDILGRIILVQPAICNR